LQNELAVVPVHIGEDRRHVLGADAVEVQILVPQPTFVQVQPPLIWNA
jgi:hypothetical protein